MSKDRVETFSDGVFAIVLTLLVLELRVPNIAPHSSIADYAIALSPVVPKFFSFVLTFVIIAIHWVSHHYFFRHLKSVPLKIVWLNNLFLLWVCLMPFPTAMFGDHPTDQFPVILFGFNQLLAALTFYAFRSYARSKKLFTGNQEEIDTLGPRHSIPAITIYSLSIVLAFMNVYLAIACLIFIPFLYFIPNFVRVK
jgi:uncharacterized membrane protein